MPHVTDDAQRRQRSAALYAEAKQTLSYAANQLRVLAERSRSTAAELQDELRARRREEQERSIESDPALDPLRRRELEELGADVVRARSELARLDLAVQGLEANWLFLERGSEGSLVVDMIEMRLRTLSG